MLIILLSTFGLTFKIIAVFTGKCKPQTVSFLNYPPGVVLETQTILVPCQDKSLLSTKENKSGLWKVGIGSCFNGYVILDNVREDDGLICTVHQKMLSADC